MSPDLLALLDQLDQARAAATPGPWAQSNADRAYVIAPRGDEDYEDVADAGARCSPGRPGWEEAEADAALIVAAVNAQLKLTAALRAVLDLADSLERSYVSQPLVRADGAAERIRHAVTAALTPEQVQP